MASSTINTLLQRYRGDVELFIRGFFEEWTKKSENSLIEMLAYQVGIRNEAGLITHGPLLGKMLRSTLCLLSLAATSHNNQWDYGIPTAAGIEIFHNGTLIHDDVQDDDRERRHRPTVWAKWNKSQAINAGDAAVLLGHKAILSTDVSPVLVNQVAAFLTDQFLAVTFGQERDVSFEARDMITLAEYEQMIDGKTGALIRASILAGAMLGQASSDTLLQLGVFGHEIGAMFQIQDDILGIWGSPAQTGKSADSDIRQKKKSLPIVIAWQNATQSLLSDLTALYKKPVMTDEDILSVKQILGETGAYDDCSAMLSQHQQFALQAIDKAALPQWAKDDFHLIANFFTVRNS